jgi:hypothetical protein
MACNPPGHPAATPRPTGTFPRQHGDERKTVGNLVGPALSAAGGRVDLVVSAIRDDNPTAPVQVVDCGSHVYVLAPRCLLATERSLRWHLGPRFGLCALEAIVVSSVGLMRRTAEAITWAPDPALPGDWTDPGDVVGDPTGTTSTSLRSASV